jgi:hypothetical protein
VKFAGRVKFVPMAQVKLQAKLAVAEVFIKEIHNFLPTAKNITFAKQKLHLMKLNFTFKQT